MDIYTDGGCWGNPGPGGWAFILETKGLRFSGNGGEPLTTNNRMELSAVIHALKSVLAARLGDQSLPGLDAGENIVIHTDSQYVQKGITLWIHGWMKNGWKTAAKDPVKNKEYWQELWALQGQLPLKWQWVKGHAGHEQNEACDALVQEAIAALNPDAPSAQ